MFVGSRDVGLDLVREGYAWHFKHFAKEQTDIERFDYEQAESEARSTRLGLWQDPNPEPPWEYRARKRRARVNPVHQSAAPLLVQYGVNLRLSD